MSARPVSGDPEVSPGGGVDRRPVPWLLVPGPVAGVERLRAGRGCLSLEALTSGSVQMLVVLMKNFGRLKIGTSASLAPSQHAELGPSLRIPNPRASSYVPALLHPRPFSRQGRFLAEVIKAGSSSCQRQLGPARQGGTSAKADGA